MTEIVEANTGGGQVPPQSARSPIIRHHTRNAYDIQELRIATGLRLFALFRDRFSTEDAKPEPAVEIPENATPEEAAALRSEAAEKADRKRGKIIAQIKESYDRVTDGIAAESRKKNYKFDGVLQTEAEILFVQNYLDLLANEKEAFKRLDKALRCDDFYVSWLSAVKGIGPAMAGVIISELDPFKAKYASSFWAYCGLDVVNVFDPETGELIASEGRSRKKTHLVESKYTAADGTEQTKMGLSYNPWIKTKLLAVVASSFMKAGNEKYVQIYQNYKFRQLNRPELQERKGLKAIAHKRATRYMIKMFLIDLHTAWRTHYGLEVYPSYAEAKLGLTHGRDPSAEQK
jgi:hypothetical protein